MTSDSCLCSGDGRIFGGRLNNIGAARDSLWNSFSLLADCEKAFTIGRLRPNARLDGLGGAIVVAHGRKRGGGQRGQNNERT